ncbi:MAG: hypothetical protein ACXVBW_04895 [Bdellovibrionota bacterium]
MKTMKTKTLGGLTLTALASLVLCGCPGQPDSSCSKDQFDLKSSISVFTTQGNTAISGTGVFCANKSGQLPVAAPSDGGTLAQTQIFCGGSGYPLQSLNASTQMMMQNPTPTDPITSPDPNYGSCQWLSGGSSSCQDVFVYQCTLIPQAVDVPTDPANENCQPVTIANGSGKVTLRYSGKVEDFDKFLSTDAIFYLRAGGTNTPCTPDVAGPTCSMAGSNDPTTGLIISSNSNTYTGTFTCQVSSKTANNINNPPTAQLEKLLPRGKKAHSGASPAVAESVSPVHKKPLYRDNLPAGPSGSSQKADRAS